MPLGKKWTKIEEKRFKKLYWNSTWETLLKEFPDRNKGALIQKAHKLKIKKNPETCNYGFPFNGSVIGHLTKFEKGYLAGIIDGEGCIRINRRPRASNGRMVYWMFVSVTNTDIKIINWLNERIPAFTGKCHRSFKDRNRKPCFQWILTGNRKVRIFCKELAPFLVSKKNQAELIAKGYLLLTDEKRDELYEKVKQLKRA